MAMAKIAVTIDEATVRGVDRLVKEGKYPNRSKVVQSALKEILADSKKRRLAQECAKLDQAEEQALAEEALEADRWPGY